MAAGREVSVGFDIASIFAGGAEGLLKGIGDIIGKFKADPTIMAQNAEKIAELELAHRKAELEAEVALSVAQTKINEIEAASSDKFVSRWRPAVGWICGSGLSYGLIFQPLLTWVSGWITTGHPPPAPTLDTALLTTTLFGMLGLGYMRSYDKSKGTAVK